MILDWPSYRSEVSCMAIQLWPVTGPIQNHLINNTIVYIQKGQNMIKCNMEYAKGVVLKESFSSVSNMENAFLTVNLVEKLLTGKICTFI